MHKILIVDDLVENIHTIARILESLYPSARLYQATGGKRAIALCEATPFDIIISDWDMPGMTGIDLIRSLKSDPSTRHIPVIIVTAIMLTPADLDMALSAGAFDYIRNPVDPVELAARVNSALMLSLYHRKELESKNAELAEKALMLVRANEFRMSVARKLNLVYETLENNTEAQTIIGQVVNDLEERINQEYWQQFETAFQNVHDYFIKNLVSRYPDLTPAELKLSILIRLGMNNKDIASLLFQSADSIKVARSRLRKKMQIDNSISLHTFLAKF